MKNCILLILFFPSTNLFSQLSVSDLSRLTIGDEIVKSKENINALFHQKGNFYKSETYSSVYKYGYENETFDYCENCFYEFLYVDDKLSNLEIDMVYNINKEKNEVLKYLQALNKILLDFKTNSQFEFQSKYSTTISLNKINNVIDSIDSYKKYSNNEVKYYGINVYSIKNSISNEIVFLNTSIIIDSNQNNPIKEIHLLINIQLTNIKYQDYYLQYSAGTFKNADKKNQIDLAFENGVYKLPVNLAGVMTLNFTLDLGASDVSITPDIFLVLYKAGVIRDNDFIGTNTYEFADGSTAKSDVFNLKTMKIGDFELSDVRVSISNNINSPLLLDKVLYRNYLRIRLTI